MTLLELVRDDDGFVRLPPGAELFEEGDASAGVMYVLISGTAIATKDGVELRALGAGDLAGETSAIDDAPRLTTVVAKTACSFAKIDRERFLQVTKDSPEVSLEIMQAMARQFLRLNTLATNTLKFQD